jgi:hypothetical protein
MKSMRVSQEDWDAIWDRSEGVQERLFDDEGNVPPAFRATGLAYPILKLSGPLIKTKKSTYDHP